MHALRHLLAAAFALGLPMAVTGQARAPEDRAPPGEAPAARAGSPWASPPVRLIRPGVLEVGAVRLERERNVITFPAVVNMNAGIAEYLLVASSGKTHESVLRTDVPPYQIHVAMLLLGARGAGTNAFPDDPRQPLPGDRVSLEITWTAGGREHRRRGEEWVQHRQTGQPLSPGPWIYNGSRVVEGAFLAQLEGSIVSVITDSHALVNNPRPGHDNDELWIIRSEGSPEVETPVTVAIRLLDTHRPPRTIPGPPPPPRRPPASPTSPAPL
ncbi:MAG: hypothetical protein JXQ71_04430 [Verrucomicrobia bacterium]|nr:hypothetical protein [Verrucomicrobiota bacterium]